MALASVKARKTFSGDVFKTLCKETLLSAINVVLVSYSYGFTETPVFEVVAAPPEHPGWVVKGNKISEPIMMRTNFAEFLILLN